MVNWLEIQWQKGLDLQKKKEQQEIFTLHNTSTHRIRIVNLYTNKCI